MTAVTAASLRTAAWPNIDAAEKSNAQIDVSIFITEASTAGTKDKNSELSPCGCHEPVKLLFVFRLLFAMLCKSRGYSGQ